MKVKQADGVISRKIEGRWVILERNKKFIRELNDSAGLIWALSKEPVSVTEIYFRVSAFCRRPISKIKKDVRGFIDEYLKEGFLIKTV